MEARITNDYEGSDMKTAAIYTRKSTSGISRQINSLIYQNEIVSCFAENNDYKVVQEFSDTMTGTHNDRPGLQSAFEWLAQDKSRTLIVYRVDRIARNLSVWGELEPVLNQIRVVELGNEPASLLVISVLLSVAAQESRNISCRVKAAYKSIKARNPDHKWGSAESLDKGRPKALKTRLANADDYAGRLKSMDIRLEDAGMTTNKEKVAYLNSIGFTSRRGGRLTEQGYGRTLKRLAS